MNEITGRYTITQAQTDAFAGLSGDYNPLHVDPVHARRLQFGRPVIHGIHHLLRTWDQAAAQHPVLAERRLTGLRAAFPSPAFVDQPIEYSGTLSEDGRKLDLSARSRGNMVLSLGLEFSDAAPASPATAADARPPRESPLEQELPPALTEGTLPLLLERAGAGGLFPTLSRSQPAGLLAQMLATTRLVGMISPGLHSIYSQLRLDFSAEGIAAADTLAWDIQSRDPRVQQLCLGVRGAGMQGVLDAFVRPRPVAQPSYTEVRTRLQEDERWPQRALVIGGSRGVGEITAKLLAAAGAEVIISYRLGETDAQQVVEEIRAGGGHCRALQFDVTAEALPEARPFDGGKAPTHVYYFASPRIDANRSPVWQHEIFARLSRIYLQAFHQAVNHYAAGAGQITFFYPSSIYVEQPEPGFAEYAAAKAAGEALCVQLTARHRRARFFTPRLPRMATDQTASIIPLRSAPALEVMIRELRVMAATIAAILVVLGAVFGVEGLDQLVLEAE